MLNSRKQFKNSQKKAQKLCQIIQKSFQTTEIIFDPKMMIKLTKTINIAKYDRKTT